MSEGFIHVKKNSFYKAPLPFQGQKKSFLKQTEVLKRWELEG